MNLDGTEVLPLTDLSAFPAGVEAPEWSPDGSRIAFDSEADDGHLHIFVVNADGTGLTQITSGDDDEIDATWSPDGTRLAVETQRSPSEPTGIAIVDVATGEIRMITRSRDNLVVTWKEAGLGDNLNIDYEASATATREDSCVNKGGQIPEDPKKTTTVTETNAACTFSARRGQARGPLGSTTSPFPPASTNPTRARHAVRNVAVFQYAVGRCTHWTSMLRLENGR